MRPREIGYPPGDEVDLLKMGNPLREERDLPEETCPRSLGEHGPHSENKAPEYQASVAGSQETLKAFLLGGTWKSLAHP